MNDFDTRGEVSAYYEGMKDGAGEYERELAVRKELHETLVDFIAAVRVVGGWNPQAKAEQILLAACDTAEQKMNNAYKNN